MEATRINLRRAGVASRAEAELVATRAGGYDAVLLEAPAGAALPLRAPGGKAALLCDRAVPPDPLRAWHIITPGAGAWLLAVLSFGRIAPSGRWSE